MANLAKNMYHTMRKKQWHSQQRDTLVNFEAGTLKSGHPIDRVFLQPKKNTFYKDIWHCRSFTEARVLAAKILACPDVFYLEFKGSWVWVDHKPPVGKDVIKLEGQDTDSRVTVTGRK